MKLYHKYFSCVSAKSWCLSKKDSENYVAITQGAGRSRALLEGGGRGASTLVERMVCYGNLLWRLMGRTKGMGNGIFFTQVGQFDLVHRFFL
jgi:hypothetical protein